MSDCAVRVDGPALVRWIRATTNYSQEDIALLCGMQAQSRTLVSMWETGAREPTLRQWRVLLRLSPYLSHPPSGGAPFNRCLVVKESVDA